MEINNKEVGFRIKSIRQKNGKTTKEFGSLIDGASDSLVSRWERGVNLPNTKRLKLIAELGNVSVNELLYGDRKAYIAQLVNVEFEKFLEELKRFEVLDTPVLYDLYKDKGDEIKKRTIRELTDPASLSYKTSYDDLPTLIYNHFKAMISNHANNDTMLLLKLSEISSEMKDYLENSYGKSQANNEILPNPHLNQEYYKILSEKLNDLIATIDELYLR